ncbi:MAG: hypothetical protein FWH40_05590 [Coriobacteriia bacterium]|nr:hypothetical protein [Coriobacteriia bacterium]
MNNQGTTKKTLPNYIIWLLVFFWPIGLYLLYTHMTSDKTDLMRNSKILKNFGIGFFIFGAISTVSFLVRLDEFGISANILYIFFAISFAVGGFMMIRLSQRKMLMAQRYRKYIAQIVNQDKRSLNDIAFALEIEYPEVVSDLEKMIELGFFTNAYIDEKSRSIVLPDLLPNDKDDHIRVVRCSSCGGNNKLAANKPPICEYCDSALA